MFEHPYQLGLAGAAGSSLLLLLFQTGLVRAARKRAGSERIVSFWDLVVRDGCERYSLSRLQFYLWFLAIVVSYAAVCMALGHLMELSEGLIILLGVNVTATVTASAIDTAQDKLKASRPAASPTTEAQATEPDEDPRTPDFVRDIFFQSGNSLDLPRTQMFVFTIIVLAGFIWMLINSFRSGSPQLPHVPNSLAALMGISHGAYLGVKATSKSQ